MQSSNRKKMIQQGFATLASGYGQPSLSSSSSETAKRLVEHLNLKPTDNPHDVYIGIGSSSLFSDHL